MNLLRRIANALANEPIVAIAGTVQSALVWLFTFVVTGWNPTAHQQQLAGLATGAAVLISFVARQFVTPIRKLTAAPKSSDGNAHVITTLRESEPNSVTHAYGWRPDKPDFRDHAFTAVLEPEQLPQSLDLRESGHLPPLYDQGQLGSCTANGIGAAVDFDNHKETGAWVTPSRLFIYWNERSDEGTVDEDAGAEIRDGVKVLNRYGVCPESDWPYDISRFTERPPAGCYTEGLTDRALAYKRVGQDAHELKAALAQGFPVVVGISVYESFESAEVAQTGEVPMPAQHEKNLGGHCVLLVGYRADGSWILRNSWGAQWGDAGHFYLPAEYLTNPGLSSDFWTISRTGKD